MAVLILALALAIRVTMLSSEVVNPLPTPEEAVAASVTTLLRVAACVRSTSALAVAKLLASAATILAMASVAEVVLDAP